MAYHEAGHALVAEVSMANQIPTGAGEGMTSMKSGEGMKGINVIQPV